MKTTMVIDMTEAVNNRTADFYKKRVMEHINELGLSVAGEDFPPVRSGVEEAGYGNLLTVGTAPNHDIEWIRRPEFACEKGYKPVYDIVKDYNDIVKGLIRYAEEKNTINLKYGGKVTFHDGFIKVGTEIVTYDELYKIARKL